MGFNGIYPLVTYHGCVTIEIMTIEIVDFPMKHGEFPQLCNKLPEGMLVYQRVSQKQEHQIILDHIRSISVTISGRNLSLFSLIHSKHIQTEILTLFAVDLLIASMCLENSWQLQIAPHLIGDMNRPWRVPFIAPSVHHWVVDHKPTCLIHQSYRHVIQYHVQSLLICLSCRSGELQLQTYNVDLLIMDLHFFIDLESKIIPDDIRLIMPQVVRCNPAHVASTPKRKTQSSDI